MESVELFDVEEEEVRRILDALPVYWYRLKSLFEPSLVPVLRKFGKRGTLIFGVHIFACGKNDIITVLSEYHSDLKTANFDIQGNSLLSWSRIIENENAEIRISEIIEDILQDNFASPIQVFVCPQCEAAYIINLEQDVKNGLIECQGCGKSVRYTKNLVPPELQ